MTDRRLDGTKAVRLLSADETRTRLASALTGSAADVERARLLPSPAAHDAAQLLTLLPPWAAEAGALMLEPLRPGAAGVAWVWCAPEKDAPVDTCPSQLVMALPGGRYLVSTFDAGLKRVTASESAAGGPLVCGPPFAGAPLVIVARRVSSARSGSASR